LLAGLGWQALTPMRIEEVGEAAGPARPAASGTMRLWPVSRAVNNARNHAPELLDAIDDTAAPPPSDARPFATAPRPVPLASISRSAAGYPAGLAYTKSR
jgi:hypothetical protein